MCYDPDYNDLAKEEMLKLWEYAVADAALIEAVLYSRPQLVGCATPFRVPKRAS